MRKAGVWDEDAVKMRGKENVELRGIGRGRSSHEMVLASYVIRQILREVYNL